MDAGNWFEAWPCACGDLRMIGCDGLEIELICDWGGKVFRRPRDQCQMHYPLVWVCFPKFSLKRKSLLHGSG